MNSDSTILLWLIFIAVAVALAAWGYVMQRRRAEAFRALAQQLGLDYHARSRGIPKTHDYFDALNRGDSRYAANILAGRYRDYEVLAFDYHCTVGSGKHRTHIQFSFFMLRLPKPFPELRIYPENILSRIGQTLGFEDIDFESVEFSQAFTVRARDKKFAYDVCHARMMEHLLAHPALSLEVEQEWIAAAASECVEPEAVPLWLNTLVEVRELFPEYLFTP